MRDFMRDVTYLCALSCNVGKLRVNGKI